VTQRQAPLVVLALICGLAPARDAVAGQQTSKPRDLRARLVSTPPKLDGVLDDEAWSASAEELD
jgi:hypothetical protein